MLYIALLLWAIFFIILAWNMLPSWYMPTIIILSAFAGVMDALRKRRIEKEKEEKRKRKKESDDFPEVY